MIQSTGIPEGYAALGLGDRYFMGLGTSKGGHIEYSDEYKFLEDERTYLVKLYGNGRPKDENAFVLLDIRGLKASPLKVEVTNMDEMPTG